MILSAESTAPTLKPTPNIALINQTISLFLTKLNQLGYPLGSSPNIALSPEELAFLATYYESPDQTPEAISTDPNELHFEIKRGLMRLNCFLLVLQGGEAAYSAFTRALQNSAIKLSFEHFQELHIQVQQLSEEERKAIRLSCLLTFNTKIGSDLEGKLRQLQVSDFKFSTDAEIFLTQLARKLDQHPALMSVLPLTQSIAPSSASTATAQTAATSSSQATALSFFSNPQEFPPSATQASSSSSSQAPVSVFFSAPSAAVSSNPLYSANAHPLVKHMAMMYFPLHLRHILFLEGGITMFTPLINAIKAKQISLEEFRLWKWRWLTNLFAFQLNSENLPIFYVNPMHKYSTLVFNLLESLWKNPDQDIIGDYLRARIQEIGLTFPSDFTEEEKTLVSKLIVQVNQPIITTEVRAKAVLEGYLEYRNKHGHALAQSYKEWRMDPTLITPTYIPSIPNSAIKYFQRKHAQSEIVALSSSITFTCETLYGVFTTTRNGRRDFCISAWKMMKIPQGSEFPPLLLEILDQWKRGQSFAFTAKPGPSPDKPWDFVSEPVAPKLKLV